MHTYKLEWVRFHGLTDDEEIEEGKKLKGTVWKATDHEHLVQQLEEPKGLKIRYIAYHCTRNRQKKPDNPDQ
jgi:hypothetical protein